MCEEKKAAPAAEAGPVAAWMTPEGICLESTMSYALHQKITGTWDDKHYPELPKSAGLVTTQEPITVSGWVKHLEEPGFTEDQLRAYADATCALRAQAAPVAQADAAYAELAEKLQHGAVASGSDGEWVSIRRYVRDEAVAALRASHGQAPVRAAQKYDDTLVPFLALMRRELHANSSKGDRPGWLSMRPDQCLLEIYWHAAKLSAAVKNGDQALIAEHAADVANMAMMQADIAGLLSLPTAQPAPVAQGDAAQPRLTVRLTSFPESNGKRNWTAMFVRAEKFSGLLGNAGGITIAHGELWSRVAYAAECARFLIGERDTEPCIFDYSTDIQTPDEWQGETRRAARAQAKEGGA